MVLVYPGFQAGCRSQGNTRRARARSLRDTFRIKIYRLWEYLYFKFVWRSRLVPGVGCFRFRGFAPVVGPNYGGVRPYKATPWVTLVVYPTMCGWSVS